MFFIQTIKKFGIPIQIFYFSGFQFKIHVYKRIPFVYITFIYFLMYVCNVLSVKNIHSYAVVHMSVDILLGLLSSSFYFCICSYTNIYKNWLMYQYYKADQNENKVQKKKKIES